MVPEGAGDAQDADGDRTLAHGQPVEEAFDDGPLLGRLPVSQRP